MKTTLSVLLSMLLAACGGGSSAKPVILMPGDSLTSARALAVPPAQRLQQILGDQYEVRDRAVPGATISQSLDGHANGDIVWSWPVFADELKQDRPAITLLRWGGSDAVAQTPPEEFRAELTQAVQEAKAAGAVYVIGVIESPQFAAASEVTDRINREVAGAQGVPFIDIRSLPFDAATDIVAGDVHPTQAYSDRIVALVAQTLRPGP